MLNKQKGSYSSVVMYVCWLEQISMQPLKTMAITCSLSILKEKLKKKLCIAEYGIIYQPEVAGAKLKLFA